MQTRTEQDQDLCIIDAGQDVRRLSEAVDAPKSLIDGVGGPVQSAHLEQ